MKFKYGFTYGLILLAATALLAGCAGFWDAPASTTTTTTTATTDSSGVFYVLNQTTKQIAAYYISTGTLEQVSGSPYNLSSAPNCIAVAPGGGGCAGAASGLTRLRCLDKLRHALRREEGRKGTEIERLETRRPGGQPDDDRLLAMLRLDVRGGRPGPGRAGGPGPVLGRAGRAARPGRPRRELARLTEQEAALARGAPEESRTITFDSSSLTIMIRIDANADGTVRVDGWLAPPQRRAGWRSRCRTGRSRTDADVDGRFAFLRCPGAPLRIVVRQPEQSPGGSQRAPLGMKTVVTPALVL